MPGGAQPARDAVELAAVHPCLQQDQLGERVEHWLDRPFVDARVHVKVVERDGRLRFTLRFRDDPPLEREFPDLPRECDALRSAVALSIALAIDAVAPAAPAAPARPPWLLGADVAFVPRLLGHEAFGGTLEVVAPLSERFRPAFGAVAAASGDQRLGVARYVAWVVAARADACGYLLVTRALELAACAGARAGALTTVGRGAESPRTVSRPWLVGALGLEAQLLLTRQFGVHLGVELLASPQPGAVQVVDEADAPVSRRRLPQVGGLLRIGPSAFF